MTVFLYGPYQRDIRCALRKTICHKRSNERSGSLEANGIHSCSAVPREQRAPPSICIRTGLPKSVLLHSKLITNFPRLTEPPIAHSPAPLTRV